MSEGRDFLIRWRAFSLHLKNEGVEIPEPYAQMERASHRALRVMEAVRRGEGEDAVGPLYTAVGRRIHHDGHNPLSDVDDVVAASGLDRRYARAADDESWDQVIRRSMDEALGLAGEDVGSPVLAFAPNDGPPVGFFGPIVSPPPTGTAGLQLWDGLAVVAAVPGFYELKRSRSGDPLMGPLP